MTAAPHGRIATLVPREGASAAESPALLSKARLAPPRTPAHVVATERYRQWLDPVLTHDVTLVAAPAAHGKSVFAAQLHGEMIEAGFAAAWVSCHRLPAGALRDHAVAALRTAIHDDQKLPLPDSPADLAVELANRVHDHHDPVLLCLDDVDRASDRADVDFLAHLIGNCPVNLHILLTCRHEQHLPPALIDQRAAVLRVDARTLRPRDAEVAAGFAAAGIPIGGERARELNKALGGWWGALQRAAATLQGERTSVGPDDWTQRSVEWVAPLLRETLDALPAHHRAMLDRCAIVPMITPALAARLSGETSAAAILREIARSSHLVEPVPGTTDHYTIHPALRAVLLTDARELSPEALGELQERAIDWYVQSGEFDQAIAVATDDPAAGAALLARVGMNAIELSGPCGVRRATARLPRSWVGADSDLARVALWSAILSGDDAAVAPGTAAMLDPAAHTTLDELRAALSGSGPATASDTTQGSEFASRLLTTMRADAILKAGDHRQAQTLLRPILRHGRAAGVGFAEALALVAMADLHRAQGRPADAERLLREGLAGLAHGAGHQSGTAALLGIALADALYLRNDLAGAGLLIDEFLPPLTRLGLPAPLFRGYRVAIRVSAASARAQEALALIETAEEIGVDRNLPIMTALGAVERLRLHIPLVVSLDEILAPDDEEMAVAAPASPKARIFALLSEARAFEAIANLDRPRLTIVASRLLRLAETVHDLELRVIGMLLNVLPQLSGRCDRMVEIDTVKFLNRAASLGFVRSMVDLLEVTGVRTSQDFNRAEYSAGSFLALLRLSRPVDSEPLGPNAAAAPAFSFFTGREVEIVSALNEGETNKMIARKLGITPETVKWHMKSLMRKLRASSREEVVNNALVLGVSFAREGPHSAPSDG